MLGKDCRDKRRLKLIAPLFFYFVNVTARTFKIFYLFLREREREQGKGREREGDRECQAGARRGAQAQNGAIWT